MSVEVKQMFIKDVTQKLSGTLTVDAMNSLTSVLADEFSKFTLQQTDDTTFDITTSEYIDEFLAAKEVEGKSPKTIARYRYVLERMFREINLPIKDVMIFTLRKYLAGLKQQGMQDITIEGVRCVISSFFGWLHRENLINSNPAGNLGPIHCEKKVKKPFSSTDVERIKENCSNIRDRAIVSLLLSTGCRISEICSLDRDSIDFANLECVVLGKGNKQRTVFLDDVTAMLVKRYLFQRTDKKRALFVGKGTDRLSPQGVRKMLKNIAQHADVEKVHPHRFRRTLATNLVDRGMPIQEVASILGHEKLETTMKYVYVNKINVHNNYQKYAGQVMA